MDRVNIQKKIFTAFDKYKFIILIAGLGLILMLLPSDEQEQHKVQNQVHSSQQMSATEELASILGQIRGVGRVRVMLTERSGPQTHYQIDESGSQSADNTTSDKQTVIISTGTGETGLVKSVSSPVYMGAIVVCQGADDPAVRLEISRAVSAVTGISMDRISVLKMK